MKFICLKCGYESSRWQRVCPKCGNEYNKETVYVEDIRNVQLLYGPRPVIPKDIKKEVDDDEEDLQELWFDEHDGQ